MVKENHHHKGQNVNSSLIQLFDFFRLIKADFLIDDKPEQTGVIPPEKVSWEHIYFHQSYNSPYTHKARQMNWNSVRSDIILPLKEKCICGNEGKIYSSAQLSIDEESEYYLVCDECFERQEEGHHPWLKARRGE